MIQLRDVSWHFKTEALEEWLADPVYTVERLHAGLEGEACKLLRPDGGAALVCKVWNRTSKPDPAMQYRLLEQLQSRDIPVSEVYGCGHDRQGNPLLLTSFDGSPLVEGEGHDVSVFAELLAGIHRIRFDDLGLAVPETHSVFERLIRYFFPALDRHPDIREVVERIRAGYKPNVLSLIHGDFNLGNIVHVEKRYCIIDWTNAQISDSRYDFAWAAFLLWLYGDEASYRRFREAYSRENDSGLSPEEYMQFETLAFLRWVLLSRSAHIPRQASTGRRIRHWKDEHSEWVREVELPDL